MPNSPRTPTMEGVAIASGVVWRCDPFDRLTVERLAAIYLARQQVFVVEQSCAYLDADGYDNRCLHLAAWADDDRTLQAYARIVAPGVKYSEASIGRVLTTDIARGTGLGRELVRRAIAISRLTYPRIGIRISAQARLIDLYAEGGFALGGMPYEEDGIPHIEMLLPPKVSA